VEGSVNKNNDKHGLTDKKKCTPFQFRKLTCPICEEQATFKTLKPSASVDEKFALDTKSIKSLILVPGFKDIVPRHYRIAKCTECSWAADLSTFEEPEAGSNLSRKAIKAAILAARISELDAEILKILSRGIGAADAISYTLIEVLKLHMLACKNLLCVPEVQQKDPYHLARFTLRTAWILEDIEESKEEWRLKAKELFDKLAPYWKGLPTTAKEFKEFSYALYEKSLTTSRLITTTREEVDLILLLARLDLVKKEHVSAKQRIRHAGTRSKEFESQTKSKYNELLVGNEEEATRFRSEGMAEVRRMTLAIEEVQKLYELEIEKFQAQEMNRALDILKGRPSEEESVVRSVLADAGISSEIVTDIINQSKKNKKSVLGWLKT
jgi:uncharacterized protein (DUF2225 family)